MLVYPDTLCIDQTARQVPAGEYKLVLKNLKKIQRPLQLLRAHSALAARYSDLKALLTP